MNILVTGDAGFIGSALVEKLLSYDMSIVGLDSHNDYYDPGLKENRVKRFSRNDNYIHHQVDIRDRSKLTSIFRSNKFDAVINLAAQAGVRYSIENPGEYIDTNVVGFGNILECCREFGVFNLIYASSSSVYGNSSLQPLNVNQKSVKPLSVYAATKIANEALAHSYSHLFNIQTIGLRFFTVYGPWGRPDMALYKFTKSITEGQPIPIYNNGNHLRDFTYIDDVVEAVSKIIQSDSVSKFSKGERDSGSAKIYNIGNGSPSSLLDYIKNIEKCLGLVAKKEFLPLQAGDVEETYADMTCFREEYDFYQQTSIKIGVKNFVDWYLDYHNTAS